MATFFMANIEPKEQHYLKGIKFRFLKTELLQERLFHPVRSHLRRRQWVVTEVYFTDAIERTKERRFLKQRGALAPSHLSTSDFTFLEPPPQITLFQYPTPISAAPHSTFHSEISCFMGLFTWVFVCLSRDQA